MTERASVAEELAERLARAVVVSEEIVASPYRRDVVDVRFTDAERNLIVAALRLEKAVLVESHTDFGHDDCVVCLFLRALARREKEGRP